MDEESDTMDDEQDYLDPVSVYADRLPSAQGPLSQIAANGYTPTFSASQQSQDSREPPTAVGAYVLAKTPTVLKDDAMDEFRRRILGLMPTPEGLAEARARSEKADEDMRAAMDAQAQYDASKKWFAFAAAAGQPTRTGAFNEGLMNMIPAYMGADQSEKDRIKSVMLERAKMEQGLAGKSLDQNLKQLDFMGKGLNAMSALQKLQLMQSGQLGDKTFAPKAQYVPGIGYVEYDPNLPRGTRSNIIFPDPIVQRTAAKLYPAYLKHAYDDLKFPTNDPGAANEWAKNAALEAAIGMLGSDPNYMRNQQGPIGPTGPTGMPIPQYPPGGPTFPVPQGGGVPGAYAPQPGGPVQSLPPMPAALPPAYTPPPPTNGSPSALRSALKVPPSVQVARNKAAQTVIANEAATGESVVPGLAGITPDAIAKASGAPATPGTGAPGAPTIRTPGDRAGEIESAKKSVDYIQGLRENLPKVQSAYTSLEMKNNIVENNIDRAIKDVGWWTAGLPANYLKGVPIVGQGAQDLAQTLQTIRANIGFDELMSMKDASKSGSSGLGQVTEAEHALLQSLWNSVEQSQSPKQLRENLRAIRKQLRISRERVRKAYETEFKPLGAEFEPFETESQKREKPPVPIDYRAKPGSTIHWGD